MLYQYYDDDDGVGCFGYFVPSILQVKMFMFEIIGQMCRADVRTLEL